MAAAKKTRAGSKPKTERYKGFYLQVTRKSSKTKGGKRVEEGQVYLAVGEPGDDGWIPILAFGLLEHLHRDAVERIIPEKIPKPTAAQQAARKRLVRKAGVKVTAKEAERIREQWGR